ncbi:hypothetical protein KCA24_33195 [Escherichia coli]|nr:hypothetical protein [Escherichia coli]
MQLLDEQLATVTRLAKDNELPDAFLTESGLKITPLEARVRVRGRVRTDKTHQYYSPHKYPNPGWGGATEGA